MAMGMDVVIVVAHATKLWRSQIKWHKWLELCSFFLFGHIRVQCMLNAFAKVFFLSESIAGHVFFLGEPALLLHCCVLFHHQ
jgi:hypothetical protein